MSKEQIISLEEAFEKGIVKIGDYIDYRAIYGEYHPKGEETGVDERHNPTFKTEDFGWRLDKFEEELILVADSVTNGELMLNGNVGYDNGIDVLNKITSQCFTDPALAAEGAISIPDFIFRKLHPCNIMEELPKYWVGANFVTDTRIHDYKWYTGLGVKYVYKGCMYGRIMVEKNYGYISSVYMGISSVRPVVFLKSNIQLVLAEGNDGSKGKPWQPLREEACPVSDVATENKIKRSLKRFFKKWTNF